MTLRAELEQILQANKLDKIMFDEAIAAILATVSKHLPKRLKYDSAKYTVTGEEAEITGYNTAITEMEAKLTESFRSVL